MLLEGDEEAEEDEDRKPVSHFFTTHHFPLIHVTSHLHNVPADKSRIPLPIDRRTLAKRRFRATASDGAEFGFDLPHPFSHHTPFHETDKAVYLIEQRPETVLEIPIRNSQQAALYGWMVGNMHFPAAFEPQAILAEDDPAVRQMLDRAKIPYQETAAIFQPAQNANAHRH